MSITFRPYQKDALEVAIDALAKKPNVLLTLPTGSGKALLLSALIKHYMEEYNGMRIIMVCHRTELVKQCLEKLKMVWPECDKYVGNGCAGLGSLKINKPVILGTVQSLSTDKRIKKLTDISLLLVDEAHHIGPIENGGGYHKLISALRKSRPSARVCGFTATPFTMLGYIYGDKIKKGFTNLFDCVDYSISMDELTEQGFLAHRQELEKSMKADLTSVKVTAGEYNLGELSGVMSRPVYIKSAVDAYKKYADGRKKVIAFCCSIEHSTLLADAFIAAGYKATAVHSKMNKQSRRQTINAFNHGDLRILTNCEILTEGFDSPAADCIMLCRPSKSPALFTQMCGRGTRLAPGKDDVLILDLVDLYRDHGSPSDPKVVVPVQREGKADKNVKGDKECPACGNVVDATSIECPECGWTWDPSELTDVAEDVKMAKVGKQIKDGKSEVLTWNAEGRVSYSGNFMLVLEAKCKPGGLIKTWVDIEGVASDYGMAKANNLWLRLAGTRPPASVREAEMRSGELKMPGRVTVETKNGFKRIRELS